MNRKAPPTGTSSPHDCNFQIPLWKGGARELYVLPNLHISVHIYGFPSVPPGVILQEQVVGFFLFSFFNSEFSMGSFNQDIV